LGRHPLWHQLLLVLVTAVPLEAAAAKLRPSLPVQFTTGYTRNAIVHHGRLDAGIQLITKPYSYLDLAVKVRQTLDG